MNEWQPIETAPKTGESILLACANSVCEGEWWPDLDMWSTDFTPSHWMPLPDPPEVSE